MKEMIKKQETEISTNVQRPAETILASDVVIPRVILQQGLSEMVRNRKAQIGDIVRSGSCEKLGDDSTPVPFIPLTYRLRWMLEEIVGTDATFKGFEERTFENENLPWDFEKDGATWRRTKMIELFALLPGDIEADLKNFDGDELPDINKVLLPVLITFRSTSYKAGSEVATHFMKVRKLQERMPAVKPYSYVLELACEPKENAKGHFFAYKVPATAKKADPKYLDICAQWYNTLTNNMDEVQTDDSEFSQVVEDTVPAASDSDEF